MDKKTMGSFIAVLRKANGMTQRDLAERLGVSDKTVSHWERDDSVPDISLIPDIAEIFNVSCDELIKGERKADQAAADEPDKFTNTRQLKNLADRNFVRLKSRSTISIGIGLVGIFTAAICNFVFYKAYLGFGLGSILLLGAVICEIIFSNLALMSINGVAEVILDAERRKIIDNVKKIYLCLLVMFGTIAPFVLLPMIYGQHGNLMIQMSAWYIYGLLSGALVFFVGLIIMYCSEKIMIKRGTYTPLDNDAGIEKLRIKHIIVTSVIAAVLVISQVVFNNLCDCNILTRHKTFKTLEAFREYAETPLEDYDKEDTSNQIILTDEEDNIIFSCKERNPNMDMIEWGTPKKDYVPIRVFTSEDMNKTAVLKSRINYVYMFAYALVIIISAGIYFKKKSEKN